MLLFVAGVLFGEIGMSLFVAGAVFGEVAVMLERNFWWQAQSLVKLQCHFSGQAPKKNGEILGGSRSAKCFFFRQDGTSKFCERTGAG